MTLKNIQLPAIVLAKLYKHSLVELLDKQNKPAQRYTEPAFKHDINKHILLLVNNADAELLTTGQFNFLSGVLMACNLSMDDVAIVNMGKQPKPGHKNTPELLKAGIIILFGIDVAALELPFKIPPFQVQLYKEKKYVHVPSLDTIENDTVLKKKLWELLKVLFSI